MSDSIDLLLQIYLLLEYSNILPRSNIRILSYSHFTMKTTILMAAVLAVATVLAAGLTVLPNSVQKAQAEICTLDNDGNQAGVNEVCTTIIGNDIDFDDGSALPYGKPMTAAEGVSTLPFGNDVD